MMKKKGGAATTAVAAVALVLLAAAAVRADVNCADVDASLRPCVGYVTGKEAAPAAECCAGVKRIRAMPSGPAERRQACECVKQAAANYQPLNADAIRDLPAQYSGTLSSSTVSSLTLTLSSSKCELTDILPQHLTDVEV
ncbi:Non-specific lipid-transfer protein [Zea mays]|uniref:Non-specific lipid-transfer protein n=1 Tax=Zea mays TaxID=4577 RepID=A0A1D6J1A0_MAIZE|nr:Non-specific lipid-transfer protein [Zea mays]